MTKVNVIDLFCGAAGGWSLGLHRAGFRTVAACEINGRRRAAYAINNPGVRMFADIRELYAEHLRDLGPIDVVVGSPPCQDASSANTKGQGIDGERTGLFWEWLRLVRELRPRWACAENSPRMRTRGIDRIIDGLEAEGYTCWPLVVGADNIGASHIRKRVWLIAADTDRIVLRQQPGRGGWSSRQGLSVAARDVGADTSWLGDEARAGRHAPEPQRGPTSQGDAHPHADADREPASPVDDEMAGKLALLERLVGRRGLEWSGGPERHLRMADGLPVGLARECVSAYGDAVLPQITEAIGRAIMRIEKDES